MSNGTTRRFDPAGGTIAAALAMLAGIILFDASKLMITSTYGVGPRMMPIVVASGLLVLAAANLVMAMRGDLPPRESADPKAILFILGGFAALIAIIARNGGFIPATAILFATTSAAFGRRAFFTDLGIGFVLGLVIFLIFDKLLTLSLPFGPIERLI